MKKPEKDYGGLIVLAFVSICFFLMYGVPWLQIRAEKRVVAEEAAKCMAEKRFQDHQGVFRVINEDVLEGYEDRLITFSAQDQCDAWARRELGLN